MNTTHQAVEAAIRETVAGYASTYSLNPGHAFQGSSVAQDMNVNIVNSLIKALSAISLPQEVAAPVDCPNCDNSRFCHRKECNIHPAPDQATHLQLQDAKDARSEHEVALRRLLCLIFSRGLAYTDDGELSDSQRHPSIDFLRDAPVDIEAKIIRRNADTLGTPTQTVLCEHSGCGSNTQVDSLTVRLNPGDKVVLLKGRMTQEFDRADAAILSSEQDQAGGGGGGV